MLSQVSRNVGFMFRETGQAMDKLGCRIMGDYAFMEERKFEKETCALRLAANTALHLDRNPCPCAPEREGGKRS